MLLTYSIERFKRELYFLHTKKLLHVSLRGTASLRLQFSSGYGKIFTSGQESAWAMTNNI